MIATNQASDELTADAFAEKMFSSFVGALDTLRFYAGERLGWYQAVADSLQAPGDELEQVMYGYSMFVCLPDGLSSTPSAGTGTVMRKPILDSYAEQAGFRSVDVLPIEDFAFFRFYQLNH